MRRTEVSSAGLLLVWLATSAGLAGHATLRVALEGEDCSALAPEDVAVEDGAAGRRVTAIERDPPRLHVLVVDDSAAMAPSRRRISRSLAGYLETISDGEDVLFATFADDLILRAGPSADRAALGAALDVALERGDSGQRTALRAALLDLLRYLEPRGEHVVVVLLTDGFDQAGPDVESADALLEAAHAIPDLSLYTIRLRGAKRDGSDSTDLLRRLAEASAGGFVEARSASAIPKALRAIQDRLTNEAYFVYETEAPADPAAEVVVRVAGQLRCRARVERLRRRAVDGTAEAGFAVETLAQGTPLPPGLEEFCPVGHRCWRPVETLRFPAADPDLRLTLVTPPTYIAGRARDVIAETGARYDATVLADSGRYRLLENAAPEVAVREFAIELPPLDEVRTTIRSPVDVLERWMMKGGGGPGVFVAGGTWFELRGAIARAIYRSRIDYRRWADERVVRLDAGRPPGLGAVLADWSADVPALELALALETRVVNRIRALGESERMTERERLEGFWQNLREWFPAPTRVRLVAPLIPIYDAVHDVIGFQRIVLPQSRRSGAPLDSLPPYPLGMRIVERLLHDRAVAAQLSRRVEVVGVGFRPVPVRDRRRPKGLDEPRAGAEAGFAPFDAFESSLRFRTPEGDVGLVSLFDWGPGDTVVLRCMRIAADDPETPFAGLLAGYVGDSALGC